MSKNEDELQTVFMQFNIDFENQKLVPITDYPWKTTKSRTPPKCDFFLPEYNLYIEVKGFMTIEAMAKMKYLSRQNFNYYIFQCTEYEWNPYIGSNDNTINNLANHSFSKSTRLKNNINAQIMELCSKNKLQLSNMSKITELRLNDFIKTKIEQFELWNGRIIV